MSFGLGSSQQAIGGIGGASAPVFGVVDASTPWIAAADGNLPLLQQALEQLQLPVTVADEEQGYTLLQAAASYSQIPVLEWIMQQQQQQAATGVEPSTALQNAVDKDGDSALHYASTAAAAQFLVQQAGIDVSIRNAAGLTALQAKQLELDELMHDEDDFDEDDIDVIHLKGMIEYLQSLSMLQQ